MPLFLWKPSYELGIPEIDHDHRQLVGIINELYEEMKQGHGHDILNQTIDRLLDYVNEHFENEESSMRVNRYPQFDEHVKEHQAFRERIVEMDQQRRLGSKQSTIELMTFLCDWLRDHVTTVDKEFGSYLKRCQGLLRPLDPDSD